MKKIYNLLCFTVAVFFMTACGKTDTQAQIPANQSESLMTESASQSDAAEGLRNVDVISENADSAETVSEIMPESAVSDETENMTKSVADIGKTENVLEMEPDETSGTEANIQNNTEENIVENINVQVGDVVFSATLEENEAVTAFVEMMQENPIVIQMSDYSGFEKVGSLGVNLPASNSQITTQAGDIVLYNGNQIVIFYGSNSWSYTRLGHIDDLTGWEEALGSGDVTVTFSVG